MTSKSNIAAITPRSVASPQQAAAANLAAALTPQFIHDVYESLPAGALSEATVTSLMNQAKTYLLTGAGLTATLSDFAGLLTASTAAPASAAAGKQLAGLITGDVVKDLITLAAPLVSATQVKSAIGLLQTDLKSGLGFEPWIKTIASDFAGYAAAAGHHG